MVITVSIHVVPSQWWKQ